MSSDFILLLINSRMADANQVLAEKDIVNLMPAIAGG